MGSAKPKSADEEVDAEKLGNRLVHLREQMESTSDRSGLNALSRIVVSSKLKQ